MTTDPGHLNLVIPDRNKATTLTLHVEKASTITITDRDGTLITAAHVLPHQGWAPFDQIHLLADDRYPLTLTTISERTDGVQTLMWSE